MRLYLLLLLLACAASSGCSDGLSPYVPPANVYGILSSDMISNGKYFIPLEEGQWEQVSNVSVRWAVGTNTHLDGTIEPIYTCWQEPKRVEIGKLYVVVSKESFEYANVGSQKEYWIRF